MLVVKVLLNIQKKDFIPNISLSIKTISIGLSTLVTVLGMSVSMLILNVQLLKYGDVAAITAIGIINGLYSFFIMPIMGIQQGMQPILGYNYGAGQSQRVFKTLKYALIIAVIYSAIFAALLQIFPTNFISIFISSESATLIVAEKRFKNHHFNVTTFKRGFLWSSILSVNWRRQNSTRT